jgi:hypothetical protein
VKREAEVEAADRAAAPSILNGYSACMRFGCTDATDVTDDSPGQTPGGLKGFLGGVGSFVVSTVEGASCSGLEALVCKGYQELGGEMPSTAYHNWLTSHGVDTSFNSTYGAGEVSAAILALAIGGGADAPGVTAAAENAGAATEGAGSGGTVQIFRNVDAREFDSIATTDKFGTGAGQMEGKWFATQGAHAEQWGQLLNGGEGVTVETRIPASVADQLYLHAGKLDGIGSAYYADADQLDLINGAMDGIRAWP